LLRDPGFLADCGREKVTHADLLRLLPGNWLNDAVINYYAAAIMQTREKVYIFNSFFWTKLEAAGYVNGDLAKWTKKVSRHHIRCLIH
jgi:sentrin-specific protease 1